MSCIWWDKLPNSFNYLNNVFESLEMGYSVVISSGNGIPWKEYFNDILQTRLREFNGEKNMQNINPDNNLGLFLFREFCKSEKRNEYRPTKTYAKFLAENDDIVLHSRYLFLETDNSQTLSEWLSVVSEYLNSRPEGSCKAGFVIEYTGTDKIKLQKGIRICQYDDVISIFDKMVFSSLVSSELNLPTGVKQYLSELISCVCGNYPELCELCAARYKEFLENPYATVSSIIAEDDMMSSTIQYSGFSSAEIEKKIWKAQVRMIYPIIEDFRREIISKYKREIECNLPIETPYGEMFYKAEDVEIGTIYHLAGNAKIPMKIEHYDKLELTKNIRNNLAHMRAVSFSEVKSVINIITQSVR